MNRTLVPIAAVCMLTFYLVLAALSPDDRPGGMDVWEFANLPIRHEGRIKPMDTVARLLLLTISERQTATDADKRKIPAIQWYLDTLVAKEFGGKAGWSDQIFRVENDQLVQQFNLKPKPEFWRYSFDELRPSLAQIGDQGAAALEKAEKDRDIVDVKVLQLYQRLAYFIAVMGFRSEPQARDPAEEKFYQMFPPQTKDEDWTSLEEVSKEFQSGGKPHSGVLPIFEILKDYAKADSAGFNKKLAAVMERVNSLKPEETRKARFETFFNHFEPFYKCALVYGFVFVVVCVSWVSWREVLSPTAFWLTVATLLLHTWAIGVRMYLQERPPITNLYSTAVFVGWGAVIAFLAIELIYKNGLGNALGAIAGLLSMILAHNLAGDSDTMPMLQAVLDTNFWLATHVTVVNLGYAATMVAGFIGIVFVVLGIGTRIMTPEVQRTVGQALYGVICFAMFFSFLGTVLGGIWADQSWGRFWGWDPKENGAVLVVIWNALILHARWGGIAKMRGISLLAIFGNIVTAWSWFGTNQLGVGLHSYGFMKGAVTWLIIWAALNLVLIGIGSIPRRYWRSYASTTAAVKPPKAKPPVSRRKSELVSAR